MKTPAPLSLPSLVVGLSCIFVGCGPEDEIHRYQVPRPQPPHRMLGAIIPQGERAWFFKLSGGNAEVAEQADRFRDFIGSVRIPQDDQSDPSWQLPAGWKQLPGGGMRFATIEIPTQEKALELTVMPLPLPPETGILSNINRWRGQMGLKPLQVQELKDHTVSLDLEGRTATLVDLVGKLGSSASMAGPFAGADMASSDAAREAHAAAGITVPESPALTYEVPPGWTPGERVVSRGGISVPRDAAFVVREGGQEAEITITSLPAAAGDPLPNANRWRGQIGLPPLSAEELAAEQSAIEIGGSEGAYFRFIGAKQAVLGVIASHGGKAWFVKLQGDHDLAIKLQEPFETFVRSIRF